MILEKTNKRNVIFISILIILALIGIVLIIAVSSSWGIGLTPDSAAYIAAARNFLNGNGLSVLYNDDGTPLNLWAPKTFSEAEHVMLWPPLYPIVLSIFGFFTTNMFEIARYLSAVLFGLNILIIGLVIKKITRSIWLSLFGAAIMITSDVVMGIHSMAWSEPLFIFFGFLGVYFIIDYLQNNKNSFLYISAILLALAFLTRYVGITLVASGALAVLFLNNRSVKKRIIDCVVFIAISCIPVSIWIISTNSSPRTFVFHPVNYIQIKFTLINISRWLLPDRIPNIIRVGISGIFVIGVISGFIIVGKKIYQRTKKSYGLQNLKSALIFLIFIIIYMSFLIISKSFFDAHIPIYDFRILSPVFIVFLIIVICFLGLLILYFKENKILKILTSAICILFLASYIVSIINPFIIGYKEGHIGYANKDWTLSETINELKKYPDSTLIYSNGPDAIYLLTGKSAKMFPLTKNPYTLEINDDYLSQMEAMIKEIREKEGILVFLIEPQEVIYHLRINLLVIPIYTL